jgi:hypothetical protein
VAAISDARRRFDRKLEDVCGTFIFDEATRSRSYDVCALCLSLCGLKVLV